MKNAKNILEEAVRCVCTDRNQQYGEPEDNFRVIAELWNVYIRKRCVGGRGGCMCDGG